MPPWSPSASGTGVISSSRQLRGWTQTIERGRQELAAALVERPMDRGRVPGAGRPQVGKKGPRAGS